MNDTTVYLEKLSLFSRMLRLGGLPIGPKETADAAEVLTALGFEDRALVKTALRTVYAKSREEQETFDRVFDGFFVSEETMRRQAEEQAKKEQEIRENIQDLKNTGCEDMLSEDQQLIYGTMSSEEREKLRGYMDKYAAIARRSPGLYDNFISSIFKKSILEQQLRLEDAALDCQSRDPELGLLCRDISRFKDSEIPKAIALIQVIARQINGELTARRNRKSHSGMLNFRRTIRKSLETGGSFYRLHYKKKRSRRKNLVLLCDVSGSMIQFSEFALRFIQSLNQVSESSRVFLFSEELCEADAFDLQDMDLFRGYVRDSGIYGKGTNLGMALRSLTTLQPAPLGPATTLLILSDAKTVDQRKALQALVEARRQAGRVLWLNPIPERKWKYVTSIRSFAEACVMIPCSTLGELAGACRRLTV